jgi:signal transduction histidine kinase
MTLSVRARLAVWYGVVMLAVLVVIGVAVALVHLRLGLARIDAGLAGNITATAGVVSNELDEGLNLREAALDALGELELPGAGVAVLTPQREVLATRVSSAPAVPSEMLFRASDDAVSTVASGAAIRLRGMDRTHRGYEFRIVTWIPLAPFDEERTTVLKTIAFSVPIALLVAATGGWLLGWRSLRPLSAMAAHADRIDHRRIDQRLPVPGSRDELERLGNAFNRLLGRLATTVQEQRRFMADASHELRTPVSIARTTAQVTLARQSRTDAEYRESLEIVAAQTGRLTRVVDDMFMLALADIDCRPLAPRTLYLDEVVKECGRAARVLGQQRQIGIVVRTPQEVPVRGDEGLLRQLLMNLLENAVRHTPDRGVVTLTLQPNGSQVELAVEDTGPGIRPADRERIFDRFVRLAHAGSDGGAGLGLPIARWIAGRHGGTVQVDSTYTAGGRFVVVLPTDGVGTPVGPVGPPHHATSNPAAPGRRTG